MSRIRGAGCRGNGAVCGIYPDGLLAVRPGQLSPVLCTIVFSNGAIRSGCVDSDASAMRYAA